MAKMAATGITEPAAGNIPGSAIRIEGAAGLLDVTPQELKDSYPSTDIFEIMIVRIT
jgi:hypothetical protein